MKKQAIKSKSGFTIIEVVLVLAIAGLIFMMVFTALPALQRSQRDTQRQNDISRMLSAITNYQSNNRNRIPTVGKTVIREEGDAGDYVTKVDDQAATGNDSGKKTFPTNSWGYFYDSYLLVGSAGATDTFEDPDGEPYGLLITKCSDNPAIKAGDPCDAEFTQRTSISFDEQSSGLGNDVTVSHAISVVTYATCDGEESRYSSGSRKLALVYKKEGGGVICINN